MRNTYYLLIPVFLLFLYSCSKDKKVTPSSTSMIVGSWKLQKQNLTQFVNGVIKVDTTISASANNKGSVQFNNDGTFVGISALSSISQNALYWQTDTLRNKYNISGSSLNIPSALPGFSLQLSFGFSSTTTGMPTFISSNEVAKITALTSSVFNLHSEFTVVYIDAAQQTVKTVADYYYTK
jgi:hypothetical protein